MINLEKGEIIDIEEGLSFVGVGLGWDANEEESGYAFDLDASAFMLGSNGKTPKDEYFVFYNNQKSPEGSVWSMGDDLTGNDSKGDEDNETLKVKLSEVPSEIQSIVFVVTIYKAKIRKQNFGMVNNAYIRIYDENTKDEIARYDLTEDFSVETAVECGRLYRQGSQWKFEAIGLGTKGGMEALLVKYVY